jgi:hypothetical protein
VVVVTPYRPANSFKRASRTSEQMMLSGLDCVELIRPPISVSAILPAPMKPIFLLLSMMTILPFQIQTLPAVVLPARDSLRDELELSRKINP